jgi:hypothetical protein
MPSKFVGLFVFMLWILAIMIVWNTLIRTWVGKHPDSPAARGLSFAV